MLMRLAHVTGLLPDASSLAFSLLLPDRELLMFRHGSHSAAMGAGPTGALDRRWHPWGAGCWPPGQPVLRAVAVLAESRDGRHCVAGAFSKGALCLGDPRRLLGESDVTRRAWPTSSASGTERGAREGRQAREGHLRGGFRTGQTLGGRVQRAFQNPVFTRV